MTKLGKDSNFNHLSIDEKVRKMEKKRVKQSNAYNNLICKMHEMS